jgi:hypothetical protein
MNATDFAPGMSVYDGEYGSIGKIVEVWVETAHGHLPFSRTMLEEYGPVEGVAPLLRAKSGFLQGRQDGIFTPKSEDLFIPLSSVVSVDPPQSITLNCSGDSSLQTFAERPGTLQTA